MEDFELLPFIRISGVGATSGAAFLNDHLYLISANSNCLYCCNIETGKVENIAICGPGEDIMAKNIEPNFESISIYNDSLFLFGSGASDKKRAAIQIFLDPLDISGFDLSAIFSQAKETFSIPDSIFNIEGAFFYDGYLYFFQRGNETKRLNGFFRVDLETFAENHEVEFFSVILPKINGITATLTDALVFSDSLFFLATAQDSNSINDYGKIGGTMIGILNNKTFEVDQFMIISNEHKFESFTVYKEYDRFIEFLVSQDNGTEEEETHIYKLILGF